MKFLELFCGAIPVVWDGLVEGVTGTMDTMVFVFQVTWEQTVDHFGPYAGTLFYSGMLLMMLILILKVPLIWWFAILYFSLEWTLDGR